MPILAEETCLFLENLLDEPVVGLGEDPLDCLVSERVWWVVYTKSRQENSLARDLLGCQIPFYLPQVAKSSLIRGRRVRTHMPVFPGYLFLYGSPDERVDSLKTNRISRILEVPSQDMLEQDLRQLAKLIATNAPLTIERRLAPGRKGPDSQRPHGRLRRRGPSTAGIGSLADRSELFAAGGFSRDQRLYGGTSLVDKGCSIGRDGGKACPISCITGNLRV